MSSNSLACRSLHSPLHAVQTKLPQVRGAEAGKILPHTQPGILFCPVPRSQAIFTVRSSKELTDAVDSVPNLVGWSSGTTGNRQDQARTCEIRPKPAKIRLVITLGDSLGAGSARRSSDSVPVVPIGRL
ncbi:unnamed protein product [Calypogeia fissa]